VDDYEEHQGGDSSALGGVALNAEYGGMMKQGYDRLKEPLKELFQFDSSDLDFGRQGCELLRHL
jgi:hypothetical protein